MPVTHRLPARSCQVDPDLARWTQVDLPDGNPPIRERNLGELLRSILPFLPDDPISEGPVHLDITTRRSR
ncbi:MAG: hypothetical protein ACJ761_03510 [Chloroflexota bacterium]